MTISARVHVAETTHRTWILDVSGGGVLLKTMEAFHPKLQQIICIKSQAIGQFKARIVNISSEGIHAQVESANVIYQKSVKRLAQRFDAWNQTIN